MRIVGLEAIRMRPARQGDLEEVLDILGEAAAYARQQGIDQWPARFSDELVAQAIRARQVFVADAGTLAGTLTLVWSDPMMWGERDDCGFVHRLAIRRNYRGLGSRMLDWSAEQVRAAGRRYLCLDVMSGNPALRRYYERLGFQHRGDIAGTHQHPHRATERTTWHTSLYERAV